MSTTSQIEHFLGIWALLSFASRMQEVMWRRLCWASSEGQIPTDRDIYVCVCDMWCPLTREAQDSEPFVLGLSAVLLRCSVPSSYTEPEEWSRVLRCYPKGITPTYVGVRTFIHFKCLIQLQSIGTKRAIIYYLPPQPLPHPHPERWLQQKESHFWLSCLLNGGGEDRLHYIPRELYLMFYV